MGKIEPSPLITFTDQLTLGVAMKFIDDIGSRAAVLVDQERKVLGLLTDGDIRRALLSGASLADSCDEYMNKSPTLADISEDSIRLFAEKSNHEFIIRVDESSRFLDMHYIPLQSTTLPPALILAGGKGTRLRPLTIDVPKPLLKVGTISILERIIKDLQLAGVRKFYFSLNYRSEKVIEFLERFERDNFSFEYFIENQELGTAGPIFNNSELLKQHENFFVINGDLMATPDYASLYSSHQKTESDITIMSVRQQYQIEYGVLDLSDDQAIKVDEKPTQTFEMAAGIYLLRSKNLKNQGFVGRLDMPELINQLSDAGFRVTRVPHFGRWIDIGRPADLEKAREIFGKRP